MTSGQWQYMSVDAQAYLNISQNLAQIYKEKLKNHPKCQTLSLDYIRFYPLWLAMQDDSELTAVE